MKRVAVMEIGECSGNPRAWFVALMYRGKTLHTYTGTKDEVGTLIQQAHTNALNRGFHNTRQVWIPR